MEEPEISWRSLFLTESSVWMLLALVSLMALYITFGIIRPVTGGGDVAPLGALKTFTSMESGFSLRYPAARWRRLGDNAGRAFAFSASDNEPPAFFGIRSQPISPKNVGYAGLARMLDKKLAAKFASFRKVDQGIIVLGDGRRALLYDYAFVSAKGVKTREQLTVVLAKTKVFHITAWSREADFDTIRDDLDAMVKSFTVSR